MTTSPTKTPSASTPLRIAGVSAKLPSFWPNDVELWFCLCEAEFDNCGITRQDTRFGHIARSLPPEVAQEVRDLIVSRPTTNPYDELKAAVIKRTSVSEQRRLRQLLSEEDLGDRKPTQLLRRMRQLLGARKFEEALLRELFLQRLPNHAQSILVASKDTVALEELAELADRILDVQSQGPIVAAVAKPRQDADLLDRLERLELAVKRIEDSLSATRQQAPRGRSASRHHNGHRSGSHARTSARTDAEQCWYHRKFGDRAERCVSPCSAGNGRAQQ